MTTSQFKKIARILKEVYAELEKEVIDKGGDILSPEYETLVAEARLAVLEKAGFTLEEYRQAKLKVSKLTPADVISEIERVEHRLNPLEEAHIPTRAEIREIAHEVAEEYIVPPQVTNQVVERITIEKPIKETVEVRVEYDDSSIKEKIESIGERLTNIKIPEFNIEAIKSDLKLDFGAMFEHNIDMMGMPDFRKLAMGLQGQIDKITSDITAIDSSVTLLDVSANSTTAPLSIYNLSAGIPVNFKSSDGNTLLYLDETNERIGVGTASPGDVLHVAGGIRSQDATNPYILLNKTDATARAWYMQVSGDNLNFALGGSSKLSILTDGNVGIGTDAPDDELTVAGTIRSEDDATNYTQYNASGIDVYKSGASALDINTDGATSFFYSKQIPLTFRAIDSNITFQNGLMYLDEVTQRVGIGTTGPTYKLEVVSGTSNGFYFNGTYNKLQANAGYTEIESYHNTRMVIDSTASYADRYFSIAKGASYIGGGSPTELFRVQENGNVGIGTISPASKLEVSGIARVTRSDDVSQYGLISIENGNVDYDAVGSINHVWKNAGSEKMRLDTSGNLGIGVSPATRLQVNGNANDDVEALKVANSNATGGTGIILDRKVDYRATKIKFSLADVGEWYAGVLRDSGSPTTSFHIGTGEDIGSTAPVLSLLTSGNVGIGNKSPSYQLDIAKAADTYMRIKRTDSNGTAGLRVANSVQEFFLGTSYSLGGNAFEIYDITDGVSRMSIDTSGNIGINTTGPGFKFDVKLADYTFVDQVHISNGGSYGLYLNGTDRSTSGTGFAGNFRYDTGTPADSRPQEATADGILFDNGISFFSNSGLTGNVAFTPTTRIKITTTAISPGANDGLTLGTTALQFSDLFLAEGGVINWDNGDATLTQAGNVVTLAGANLVAAINERVVTTTDDATAVIDVTLTDVYELTAIANNTTFSTTGSPTDGQNIIIRWKDAGVSKTLTWDAIFVAIGVTLPASTTAGKWQYVGCQYNSGAAKFHAIAVATQA